MLPVLAGLAGYLMSNPRRKRRRRNPDASYTPEDQLRRKVENHQKAAKWYRERAEMWLKEGRPDLAERAQRDAAEEAAKARHLLGMADNPRRTTKRRKTRRVKAVKGKWKTVTTITKTVKRQKVNPPKTEKAAYDLGYSEGSDRSGMSGRLSAWPSEQDFNKPDKLVRAFMRGFSDGQKEQDRGTPAWATNPNDFHSLTTAIVSETSGSDAHKVEMLGKIGVPKATAEALVAGWHRWNAAHPNKHVKHFAAQLRRETRSNPSTPLTDSSRHISHDHYFITDREAGALVKQYGNGKLPKPAYEQAIDTPEGKFWLNRTPVAYDPRFKNKRGWVWCVYPRASR